MSGTATREEAIAKVRELISDIRTAMLTTIGQDGSLCSRPMVAQQKEFDGDLWFFTAANTTKVRDLVAHPQVNVAYVLPRDHCYVSLSGRASLVRDRRKAEELWHPAYKAWIPLGLEDPDLALIRVEVDRAEYWDASSSRMVILPSLKEGAEQR